MSGSLEYRLNTVYHEIRLFFLPIIIMVWLLYAVLVFLNVYFLLCFPAILFLSGKGSRSCRFLADRIICLTDFDLHYPELQGYFHSNFEPDTKKFWIKYHLVKFFVHRPYYRCRSATLHHWKVRKYA